MCSVAGGRLFNEKANRGVRALADLAYLQCKIGKFGCVTAPFLWRKASRLNGQLRDTVLWNRRLRGIISAKLKSASGGLSVQFIFCSKHHFFNFSKKIFCLFQIGCVVSIEVLFVCLKDALVSVVESDTDPVADAFRRDIVPVVNREFHRDITLFVPSTGQAFLRLLNRFAEVFFGKLKMCFEKPQQVRELRFLAFIIINGNPDR